jgi:uroporphyrinogen decarboxylase
MGNIDVRKMSESAQALEAEVRAKLATAKQGGGYIYHSDHSVPPTVSLDRYHFLMKLLDRYGTYS